METFKCVSEGYVSESFIDSQVIFREVAGRGFRRVQGTIRLFKAFRKVSESSRAFQGDSEPNDSHRTHR